MNGESKNGRDASFEYIYFMMDQFSTISPYEIFRESMSGTTECTRKSGVLGSIPGLATYFRFSFRFFKKGSCQLLAKVCARSTC